MPDRHTRSSEYLAPASGTGHEIAAPPSHRTPTVDLLSDVLRSIRLTGALFFPFEAAAPWADQIPAGAGLVSSIQLGAQHVVSYHLVSHGCCWLTLADGPPARLDAGDIVVIPHGDPYTMSSAPGIRSEVPADAVLRFFREMADGTAPPVVEVAGDGGPDRCRLICGFLGCDVRPFNPVLEALPRLVHLRRGDIADDDRLGPLVAFAVAETRLQRPGAQNVLVRLSEVLFIEVIRRYLDSLPSDGTGWLSGLRDPVVGRALALLHEECGASWTLERLAKASGVSRSALAERFTHVVGQPPMRYLAHWRMQRASRLLLSGAKVSSVALEVGYQSEAAFSRAFKDIAGVSPALWRRRNSAPARSEHRIR